MDKKLTVTIGIPAHNEEANIAAIIESVMHQSQRNFILEKVVVNCDGCTDNTASIVRELMRRYPSLQLVNDGKRKGKSARLNYFFRHSTSDILICLDADTHLKNSSVISSIVHSFLEDQSVSLVGGNDVPMAARTYFESIVVLWTNVWMNLVRPLNNWVNPNNNHGRLYALKKNYFRKLTIPTTVAADDFYVFYKNIQLGYSFRFSEKAYVEYRCPNNLKDFMSQSKRFALTGKQVRQLFEGAIDFNFGYVTKGDRYKAYLTALVGHPIRFTLALLLQAYVKVQYHYMEDIYTSGVWETVMSSKEIL